MANGQFEAVLDRPQGLLDVGTVAGMSDGQLLARFTAHRDELAEIAFTALVRRHGPMVWRVCRQILGDWHTAEDAFQATFLILARRAGSIQRPELLGHWLYGVALRTAREARMRDHRRRRRESTGTEGVGSEPLSEADQPELSLVTHEAVEALHEELSRLPERYRVPVVLCELEGLTYQEAALRLRCPVGTIGVRLSRARERLRLGLTRRGLAPGAGLLGALLGAEATSAWVPSVLLVEATVRAASRFAASTAAVQGLVSPGILALTAAVLKTMALTPIKVATSLALAVAITATIAGLGTRPETETRVPSATEPAQPQHAEPPPLGNPPAGALAGQAALSPALAARFELALAMFHAAFASRPRPEPQTVQDVTGNPRSRAGSDRARGAALFAKEWVPNDPKSHGGDGLGPVYNESSCVACHGLGAPGGAGPESKNVVLVTATPIDRNHAKGLEQIHPGFHGGRSAVLHRYGTDPEYGTWRRRFYEGGPDQAPNPRVGAGEDSIDARIRTVHEQTAMDRRGRNRSVRIPARNGFNLTLSERNTPALFGAGRIDAIPAEVLVAVAQHQPERVRGRISRTPDGHIARFGWKAQIARLHEFVRGACATELGLEVPGHAQVPSPLDPSRKAQGLDMTEAECDELVAYIRALPAPVALDPYGPQGSRDIREGRRLFADVGCADCHVPTLGNVRGIYSDLLLHDMGPSLSDSASSYGIEGPPSLGAPRPQEWRTPPLWGYRDSAPYLHDGRAEDLEEAVALHGGQAQASTRRFFALSSEDRLRVEAFLKSLVAPSSTTTPGVVLAAEMESRFEQEEQTTPESLVRRRWDEALARGQRQRREEEQRRHAEEVARRAKVRFPLARALEKKGKFRGALFFYHEIAREAPDTEEGRRAAARIAALRTTNDLPEDLAPENPTGGR
jgi:RNA polymerase sigma factor (sigma-70 family)